MSDKGYPILGLRIAGLCGVLSPIVGLSSISLAITNSPWFNWRINALSDLGISNVALIFNSGLILAGLLSIIFVTGFMRIIRKHPLELIGTSLFLLGNISLVAIGIFPISAGVIHSYVSVAFFALGPIAFFFIGGGLIRRKPERYLGFFTFLIAVITLLFWLFWFRGRYPHLGIAIPEFQSSLAFSLWSIVFGARLFFARI